MFGNTILGFTAYAAVYGWVTVRVGMASFAVSSLLSARDAADLLHNPWLVKSFR